MPPKGTNSSPTAESETDGNISDDMLSLFDGSLPEDSADPQQIVAQHEPAAGHVAISQQLKGQMKPSTRKSTSMLSPEPLMLIDNENHGTADNPEQISELQIDASPQQHIQRTIQAHQDGDWVMMDGVSPQTSPLQSQMSSQAVNHTIEPMVSQMAEQVLNGMSNPMLDQEHQMRYQTQQPGNIGCPQSSPAQAPSLDKGVLESIMNQRFDQIKTPPPFATAQQTAQEQIRWPEIRKASIYPPESQSNNPLAAPEEVRWSNRTPEGQKAELFDFMEKIALHVAKSMQTQWHQRARICRAINGFLIHKVEFSISCPYCSSRNISYMEKTSKLDMSPGYQTHLKQRGEEWALETWHRCSDCVKIWKTLSHGACVTRLSHDQSPTRTPGTSTPDTSTPGTPPSISW